MLKNCTLIAYLKSSGAVLPMSDDADRQFWAEDELSNSESRQRLTTRRKRRHSVSYRNRTANRSRSFARNSSNSSSDSTSPKGSFKIVLLEYIFRVIINIYIEILNSICNIYKENISSFVF